MRVGLGRICLLLLVTGCTTTPPATVADAPTIENTGFGRHQLTPEGWTFVELRQMVHNGTGQTIWVSEFLWAKPAYEPAATPRLATEPKIEPMRELKSGQSVSFHSWILTGRRHRTQLWFREDPRGPLKSMLGPEISP